MSVSAVLVTILLVLSVVAEVLVVAGLFALRTTMQRLHLVGAATCVGPVLAGVAVLLGTHATSSQAAKGIVIALVLLLFGGVLSHETGCAAFSRESERT